MTPEWYITILSDLQGFWKLLQYYLSFLFTGNSTDTAIPSGFLGIALNHPFWLLVIVLFVLLLGGSLLASIVAIASEPPSEKKEQMERHLAKQKRHMDEKCPLDFCVREESEEFDKR